MKKLLTIVLTLLIFSTMVLPALASSSKNVEVLLSGVPSTVKAGERITITAVTPKQGSGFTDQWIGATKVETVLTQDGYYISTAEFTAQESSTIEYNISMTSGSSEVAFTGQASASVTVAQTRMLSGVEVRNIGPAQTVFSTTIYGGDVYLVWSDSTETYYGKTYFVRSNQASQIIMVPVTLDGEQYMFDAAVSLQV